MCFAKRNIIKTNRRFLTLWQARVSGGGGNGDFYASGFPKPTSSTSPPRNKFDIDNEKLIFTQLLRQSNDKLIDDLKVGIKGELENVVRTQTEILLSSANSVSSESNNTSGV